MTASKAKVGSSQPGFDSLSCSKKRQKYQREDWVGPFKRSNLVKNRFLFYSRLHQTNLESRWRTTAPAGFSNKTFLVQNERKLLKHFSVIHLFRELSICSTFVTVRRSGLFPDGFIRTNFRTA